MADRTRPFSGLIGSNRYTLGGLETAFAIGALAFSSAAISGTAEPTPFTHPSGGMIGGYRQISPVSVEVTSAGVGGISFSAQAYSGQVTDLTHLFGGLIARYREIDSTPVTTWGYLTDGSLSGTIQDVAVTVIPETSAILNATVTYLVTVARSAVGSAALNFASSATGQAALFGDGTGSLAFSADGVMSSISGVSSSGSGEGRLIFSSSAESQIDWNITLTGGIAFSANGISNPNAVGYGEGELVFTSQGISPGDTAGAGDGALTFTSAARALTWSLINTITDPWADASQGSSDWTPVNTDSETWNG